MARLPAPVMIVSVGPMAGIVIVMMAGIVMMVVVTIVMIVVVMTIVGKMLMEIMIVKIMTGETVMTMPAAARQRPGIAKTNAEGDGGGENDNPGRQNLCRHGALRGELKNAVHYRRSGAQMRPLRRSNNEDS